MPLIALFLLALACSTKPPPGRNPKPADTSPSAEDTAEPQKPTKDTTPPEPFDPTLTTIEPHARLIGLPYMKIGERVAILPAYGMNEAIIFIPNFRADDNVEPFSSYPGTLLFPGVVPPGEHLVTELWDGVSAFDGHGSFVPAGDVNDDGTIDLWVYDGLHLGPFLGRHGTDEGAVAWLEGPIDPSDDREAIIGNFDANGDGHEDVLFAPGYQMGIVRYGPFSGPIQPYSVGFDATNTTRLGNESGCGDAAPSKVRLLRDHLGAGHHAVSIANYYDCWPDTYVYDLQHPPGTKVPPTDAIAWNEGGAVVTDAGDLDGDGSPDVVVTPGLIGWYLYEGPVSGFLKDLPEPVSLMEEIGSASNVREPLGDLDGDGITEFLVLYQPPGAVDSLSSRWMVLFSPYDEDPPRPRGVEIGLFTDFNRTWGGEDWLVGDLDGDGLNDIINKSWSSDYDDPPPPPELLFAGELTIWYAADIVAAYEEALAASP